MNRETNRSMLFLAVKSPVVASRAGTGVSIAKHLAQAVASGIAILAQLACVCAWLDAAARDVCAQALRGTHATLAVEAQETSSAVANSLGHRNPRVTEDHYIAPGTNERVREQRVAEFFASTDEDSRGTV